MNVLDTAYRYALFHWRYWHILRGQYPGGDESNELIADVFEETFRRHANKTALIFEDRCWTFAEIDQIANQIAHWVIKQGVEPGAVVGLMMDNHPHFFALYFGFQRAGVRLALLNTTIKSESILHCLDEVKSKHLLVGPGVMSESDLNDLQSNQGIHLWIWGHSSPGLVPIDPEVLAEPIDPIGTGRRNALRPDGPAHYLYTSGTTGLPKAAVVSHHRVFYALHFFRRVTNVEPDGRLYVALPVFHGTGFVASFSALYWGSTIVLRRKFSVSNFWKDCIKHDVTAFAYIGELIRYLMNHPPNPEERNHKIKSCGGNGLRPDVWKVFRERTGITDIVEFYGSSEGNFGLVNLDGKPGAIGRMTRWIPGFGDIVIVKIDPVTEELERDSNGHAILCGPGEPGEALCLIENAKGEGRSFEGYTNDEATSKKIVRNVFESDDCYFRSGDLLSKDKRGYFYFVDRIGDTFRWHGENVSTSEVSEVINSCEDVLESCVYGVEMTGYDGRAGMATLVVSDRFDVDRFGEFLSKHLPAYACPLFLRLTNSLQTTQTFKHKKATLKTQGFDISVVSEPIFFRDTHAKAYQPLSSEIYAELKSGDRRI